jgi:hypothetical protein
MNESIFSSYRTGENRVTASILAVLRCLALPRIERILAALSRDSSFELMHFENQISKKDGDSVPDAEISSSFRLLVETKTSPKKGTEIQLQGHLKELDRTKENTQILLFLTPDAGKPPVVDEIGDKRLVWSSFADLDQAVEEIFGDPADKEVVSEREQFLLRELQKMLLAEGLLGSPRDVLVIPGRRAWPLYNEVHAYVCQEGRPFQKALYLAFYAENQIYPLVPKIEDVRDEVVFEPGANKGKYEQVVRKTLAVYERGDWPYKVSRQKVILLSAPDAPETVKLEGPIVNDTTSATGRSIAFTQNQRYVTLDAIRKAKMTSELVDD